MGIDREWSSVFAGCNHGVVMITSLQGMHAWLLQRLSAVFILLYFIFVLTYFLFASPTSYEEWRGDVTSMPSALLMTLFFIALSLHAWIGVRDIAIDYVHRLTFRLILLSVVATVILGQTLWLIFILLKAMQ